LELSDELKKKDWLLSLPAGTVLKFKDFNLPYKKFEVVLYNDQDIIYFMIINSRPRKQDIDSDRINNYVCLQAKDYKFLKEGPSFINCNVIRPKLIKDLLPEINENVELGKLSSDKIKEIIEKVKKIDISPEKRDKIISAFEKVINNSVPT